MTRKDVLGLFVALVWAVEAAVPLGASAADCNDNGVEDVCDLACEPLGGPCDVPVCGTSPDCNDNGIPDECDIAPCPALNAVFLIDSSESMPSINENRPYM